MLLYRGYMLLYICRCVSQDVDNHRGESLIRLVLQFLVIFHKPCFCKSTNYFESVIFRGGGTVFIFRGVLGFFDVFSMYDLVRSTQTV